MNKILSSILIAIILLASPASFAQEASRQLVPVMRGNVHVQLVFPTSAVGIYRISDEEIAETVQQTQDRMNATWVAHAPESMQLKITVSAIRVLISSEPVLVSEETWVVETLIGLLGQQKGLDSESRFASADRYREVVRDAGSYDHVSLQFVLARDLEDPRQYRGFSYLPGPYSIVSNLANKLALGKIITHELGHNPFGALDEYSPCTKDGFGLRPDATNGNCEDFVGNQNQLFCVMDDANVSDVCIFTARQIGWTDVITIPVITSAKKKPSKTVIKGKSFIKTNLMVYVNGRRLETSLVVFKDSTKIVIKAVLNKGDVIVARNYNGVDSNIVTIP